MKYYYSYLACIISVGAVLGTIAAIEMPRKPKDENGKVYVLPRVEDMAINPNPLSF